MSSVYSHMLVSDLLGVININDIKKKKTNVSFFEKKAVLAHNF